jgi:hypothetical protein
LGDEVVGVFVPLHALAGVALERSAGGGVLWCVGAELIFLSIKIH